MATTATRDPVTATSHRKRRRRAFAVIAAVLAALVVWSVAVPLLGVPLAVRATASGDGVHTVGPASVLVVSLFVSVLGWSLLAALERRTPRATTIWTITAGAALLLSAGGPLTAAKTTAAAVALGVLHLSVAAVLIPLLRRTAPPQ